MGINVEHVIKGLQSAEDHVARAKGEDKKNAEEAQEHFERLYLSFTTKQRDAGKIPSPLAWVKIIKLGVLAAVECIDNSPDEEKKPKPEEKH